ncbi:hypothetical protein SAY87_022773 [Trapa incisa]|uniref:PGG domain-containing protein n=2 Tax=Trapa TaxID=22665 RepID=A0AAN7LCJ6_TRANT|nr:hypothetical protein SAY87_022773 [Trapa incisa]KAK4783596.1 hypothetical protein SAY86_007970 [Trapa natans]
MERQQSFSRKKMAKQYTSKRDDSPLHSAVRSGDLDLAMDILGDCGGDEDALKELVLKQNQSGETALYVAAENGHVGLVTELMRYYDIGSAGIKAQNGYDAFHIAAKRGDLEVLKVLMDLNVELSMTVDRTNTTALYTAAAQGHLEVVSLLLEKCGNLALVTRNNGKTALHSAARNGHLEVVRALLARDNSMASICDRKGQTALHMAVKGQSTDIVDELLQSDSLLANVVDNKGNTALHIATRKARDQIVLRLLKHEGINKSAVNRSRETAMDIAEKASIPEMVAIMKDHGIPSAKSINAPAPGKAATRELKQTVSDIKHEVHDQLEHTRQTRRQVHGIRKRIDKMHAEGLNNAITSSTVVAVLIATVAFAAIFSVPGQFMDDPDNIPSGYSLGEANAAPRPEFVAFFILDSVALFVSLAVVVVQTSVVVIERRAKRRMMAVINKLMWLACAMISAAFLALSYVVVGSHERWLAIGVTGIGTVIMAVTLGTMCYWVVAHRIEASKLKRSARRRYSMSSQSRSWSVSDSDIITSEYKKVYAI